MEVKKSDNRPCLPVCAQVVDSAGGGCAGCRPVKTGGFTTLGGKVVGSSTGGFPEVPLTTPRAQIFQVGIHNLGEYISLVVDVTVGSGIRRQMEAFRAGFNEVK